MSKFTSSAKENVSYLNDIRKYVEITAEEEAGLIEAYKNGSMSARDKVITAHLKYAYSLAKQFSTNESNVLDYNNEAVKGMCEAIEKFDLTRGMRFLTYAKFYMVREILHYKYRISPSIRQSNVEKVRIALNQVKEKFFAEEHRDATEDEIIELLAKRGIEVKDRVDIIALSLCSSDDVYGEESTIAESPEYVGKTSSANEYLNLMDKEDQYKRLSEAMKYLKPKEREVMTSLLGFDKDYAMSETELAIRMGVTVTRVQQIKAAATEKLHDIVLQLAA